jgi:multimeric flavodoxin WrbA
MDQLYAVSLNCTLKPEGTPSSTDRMLDLVEGELARRSVQTRRIRVASGAVKAGVTADEGLGDGWPSIRSAILESQLLVLATPIWLGHPASYAQRVLERLDAFLTDVDQRGQMRSANRVAMVAVVGNEDGAHHVGAELFQGLNDTGFALAPGAMTYWVGEAMGKVDFKDLPSVPGKVRTVARTMVTNAVHLAELLRGKPFPSLRTL